MIPRAELVRLLTSACDALRDELGACSPEEVEEHPTLKRHREVCDEIDRNLAGEKRRVDRVRRDRMDRHRREGGR